MNNKLLVIVASIALSSISISAHASIITGGALLNSADATQIEAWLGGGPVDFTNVWSGTTGATSVSWHAAVDTIGPTISIYQVSFNGGILLIGGYTQASWQGSGYVSDPNAFIFNLTSGIMQTTKNVNGLNAILTGSYNFAQFGTTDLFGGWNNLGQVYTVAGSAGNADYGLGPGVSTSILGATVFNGFSVLGLDTYSIAAGTAPAVPLPAPISLLAIGFAGLSFNRRKFHKQVS